MAKSKKARPMKKTSTKSSSKSKVFINKTFNRKGFLRKPHAIIFLVAFAILGGYFVWRSFAATTTVSYRGTVSPSRPEMSYEVTTGTGNLSYILSDTSFALRVSIKDTTGATLATSVVSKRQATGSAQVKPGTYKVVVSYDGKLDKNRSYLLKISYPLVDTTKPSAVITSPTTSPISKVVTFGATATDDTAVTKVEFYVDNQIMSIDSDSPYTYSWDTTKVTNGVRTLQIISYDAAGNTGQASISVNVDNPSLNVKTIPTSVKADCSVDVTADINSWISSIPDNSTLKFADNGCYRIDGSIKVSSRNGLVFEGANASFKATVQGGGSQWIIVRSKNITVHNMTVKGANPNAGMGDEAYVSKWENQHGFQVQGNDGVTIDKVTVTDVYGDFVYLGIADQTGWNKNIKITNNHFERNGRQGVAIAAAQDVIIANNYLGQMRRGTFDFEPNGDTWGARRIHILNNDIGPGRLIFVPITGNDDAPIEDVEISGNRLSQDFKVYLNPPSGSRRKNITITNNTTSKTFDCSSCSPITLRRVDGVIVQGNKIPMNPRNSLTAVNLSDATGVKVIGNDFTGAGKVVSVDSATSGVCEINNLPVLSTTLPKCALN